ncbi:hypothetical protein CBS115989_5821 [Aspergillus niger]|nr:hypothetical protein CBS115989_5821 [Aspergillus niger]KAI2838712.1 hypothetical protein CBS11350_8009 [Aspergillus niger]KAI2846177.1 hypothetical protein CBS11232_7495 [Aspergillus niger]KAI2872410.1 hypothetical protein CBS115988_7885 [Aspergillus niger]KAI2880946.1 hypothetical protein CBS11852_9886 [Aspergillus niger]
MKLLATLIALSIGVSQVAALAIPRSMASGPVAEEAVPTYDKRSMASGPVAEEAVPTYDKRSMASGPVAEEAVPTYDKSDEEQLAARCLTTAEQENLPAIEFESCYAGRMVSIAPSSYLSGLN